MTDSQTPQDGSGEPLVNEDDVKAREREKLDIGDSHPEDRDIRPEEEKRDGDELDLGDPHPEKRESEPRR